MRPRMRPMKFIDSMEKTSTSVLPSFLWAALLYSNQDPTSTSIPAMLPQIRSKSLGKPGTRSDVMVLAMKAPTRVNIPASSDSAKAAVGFGSTLAAKVIPTNSCLSKLSIHCNQNHEKCESTPLCRNIESTKHVTSHET